MLEGNIPLSFFTKIIMEEINDNNGNSPFKMVTIALPIDILETYMDAAYEQNMALGELLERVLINTAIERTRLNAIKHQAKKFRIETMPAVALYAVIEDEKQEIGLFRNCIAIYHCHDCGRSFTDIDNPLNVHAFFNGIFLSSTCPNCGNDKVKARVWSHEEKAFLDY